MAGQEVKVKRAAVEACMTCPLCKKLLKEATTISLCLHTFCRKCIYDKLSDEDEEDCCPVCNVDLGCVPLEKLRPDHNMQDIRGKIFPPKGRNANVPEVAPVVAPEVTTEGVSASMPLPSKRKERSLSSLVVGTPKVPAQTGLTGKRSRVLTSKAAALRSYSADDSAKIDGDSTEDQAMSTSSTESLGVGSRNKKQDSSEPSYEQTPIKGMNNDVEITEGKADLWTPLNCLVEAANRTKSSKSNAQGMFHAKSEPLNGLDNEPYMYENKVDEESPNAMDRDAYLMPKTRVKEAGQSGKGKRNSNSAGIAGPVKRRRLHAGNRNKVAPFGESSASAQAMLDACGAKRSREFSPVWFSLVATENWKGDFSLPQISACYLRIKDGKMAVSMIQKYLAKKLELSNENEVEILCRGQSVVPTLQLENLVDLWNRTTISTATGKKVPVTVGSSGKEFVMTINYCRKVQDP